MSKLEQTGGSGCVKDKFYNYLKHPELFFACSIFDSMTSLLGPPADPQARLQSSLCIALPVS